MKIKCDRRYKELKGCSCHDALPALLARLEVASKCAQLLADYADHNHVYWSSPPEEGPKCSGCNSINECDFTMNLRRQFKEAVKAWRKSKGE